MTEAEIAAYIGAGAWAPQIVTWIYRAVVRPVVTVVPEPIAEVGFTSYGPIFNLRLAFSSEHYDIIIDGIELLVSHADGDSRTFRWSGMQETQGEIRDETGQRTQIVVRDQTPIALKIGTDSLVERFIRFQETRYHDTLRPLMANLVAQFNHWKRTDPAFVQKTIDSKEMFDVVEARRQSFWWKSGNYSCKIHLSASRKFRFPKSQLSFALTGADVERLRQNLDTLSTELADTVRSNLPDFKATPVNWNWAAVDVRRPA